MNPKFLFGRIRPTNFPWPPRLRPHGLNTPPQNAHSLQISQARSLYQNSDLHTRMKISKQIPTCPSSVRFHAHRNLIFRLSSRQGRVIIPALLRKASISGPYPARTVVAAAPKAVTQARATSAAPQTNASGELATWLARYGPVEREVSPNRKQLPHHFLNLLVTDFKVPNKKSLLVK